MWKAQTKSIFVGAYIDLEKVKESKILVQYRDCAIRCFELDFHSKPKRYKNAEAGLFLDPAR